MSVIIRLQGLAWNASAMDIRQFFRGMTIPPGGVHIIGGEKGDAFIAFSSDEDARQAMMLNLGYICDSQVFLYLSSKTEMQNVISEARKGPGDAPETMSPQTKSISNDPGYGQAEEFGKSESGFHGQQQGMSISREILGNKDIGYEKMQYHGNTPLESNKGLTTATGPRQEMNRFGSFSEHSMVQHQTQSFQPNTKSLLAPIAGQIQDNLKKIMSMDIPFLKTQHSQPEKPAFLQDDSQRNPSSSSTQIVNNPTQRLPIGPPKNRDPRLNSDQPFFPDNSRTDRQQLPSVNDPRFPNTQDSNSKVDSRQDRGFAPGANTSLQQDGLPNKRLPPTADNRQDPRFAGNAQGGFRPSGRSDPRFPPTDGDKFNQGFPNDPRTFDQDKMKDRGRMTEQDQFGARGMERGSFPEQQFPFQGQQRPSFPPGPSSQLTDNTGTGLPIFQTPNQIPGKRLDAKLQENPSDMIDDSQSNDAEPDQFLQRLIEPDNEVDSKAKIKQFNQNISGHERRSLLASNEIDPNKNKKFLDAQERPNQMPGLVFPQRNDIPHQFQQPQFQPPFGPNNSNRMPGPPKGVGFPGREPHPFMMNKDKPPFEQNQQQSMRDQPMPLRKDDQPPFVRDRKQPPFMGDRDLPLKRDGDQPPFSIDKGIPSLMRDINRPPPMRNPPIDLSQPPPMRDRDQPPLINDQPPPLRGDQLPSMRDRSQLPMRDRDQPPVRDRDQPPPIRDRDQPPSMRDRGPPPQMRDRGPPPMRDRDQQPPMRDQDQPPPMRDRDQPPPMRDRGPPPMRDRDQQPPLRDRDQPPPMRDRDQPPPMRDRDQPPPMRDRDQPPPMRDRDQPPPMRDRFQPPLMRDRDQPPLMRNNEQPPFGDKQFPLGRERDQPPFMRNQENAPFAREGHRDQPPFMQNKEPPFSDRGFNHGNAEQNRRFGPPQDIEMDIDRRDRPPGPFQGPGGPGPNFQNRGPNQPPHSDFPPFDRGNEDPDYRFDRRSGGPPGPRPPFGPPLGVQPINDQNPFGNMGPNFQPGFNDGNNMGPSGFMNKPPDVRDSEGFHGNMAGNQPEMDHDFRNRGSNNPMDITNRFPDNRELRPEKDQERGRDRDRDRNRDNRERDRDRDRSRGDRDRDRERDRDRGRDRDRERDRDRNRDRERDRDRNRDSDRERDRRSSRGRDRGRERDRDRDRERDRDRDRERDKDRGERERDRDRDRDRNRDRDLRTGERRGRREDKPFDQESRGSGENRSDIDRRTDFGFDSQRFSENQHGNNQPWGNENEGWNNFENNAGEHMTMGPPLGPMNQNILPDKPRIGLLGDAPPGITPVPLMSLPEIPFDKPTGSINPPTEFSPIGHFDTASSEPPLPQDRNFHQGPDSQRPPYTNIPFEQRDGNFSDSQRGTKRPHSDELLTVFVKGLPKTTGYRDVRRFFGGCDIPRDGLKLINDLQGDRIGEAYVRFFNKSSYEQALGRNDRFLFRNRVQVISCSFEDFEKAIDSYLPDTDRERIVDSEKEKRHVDESKKSEHPSPEKKIKLEGTSSSSSPKPTNTPTALAKDVKKSPATKTHSKAGLVLQLRGLPLQITGEEIKKFFGELKIANNGDSIYIDCDTKGRCTGIAYVVFDLLRDLKKALALDSQKIAGRIIRISMGTTKDVEDLVEKQKDTKVNVGKNSNPTSATEKKSSNTAVKVDTKSKKSDTTSTKVENKKTENLKQSTEVKKDTVKKRNSSSSADKNGAGEGNTKAAYYCVNLKGLPPFVAIRDIREFFNGMEIVSRGVHFVQTSSGRPSDECFAEFVTKIDCEKAVKCDQRILGKNKISVKPVSKSEMIERIKQSKPASGGKQASAFNSSSSDGALVGGPPSGGHRCCYIKAQNLPFSVTIGEIVNFFEGYSPLPETVRVQFSGDGQIGGSTAVVGFRTKENAEKAIAGLNNKIYRNKQIVLKASPM